MPHSRTHAALLVACVGVWAAAPGARLDAQEHGAIAVGELVQGVGVTARVLMIGAHPDDEDTEIITWLARGRQGETAYLSLTRGDGGQNLIGNELGEALGVLRTEELLAARRLDGGRQYFARAYDFGFSKSADETFRHWPRDSLLADVIAIVRAFRPHVIISVFSGTPRDGHGHHQAAGILAREAYELSADTVRFPVGRQGSPWTVLRFFRGARFSPSEATHVLDVGEYSPLRGRSYAELAGESRSQHKSQGFGSLQRRGPRQAYLRLESTRIPPADTIAGPSIFSGIDTSWHRFRPRVTPATGMLLDSLQTLLPELRSRYDALAPGRLLPVLAGVQSLLGRMRRDGTDSDFAHSVDIAMERAERLAIEAAGIALEATAEHEVFALGAAVPIDVTVHNRGSDTVLVDAPATWYGDAEVVRFIREPSHQIPPRTSRTFRTSATPRGRSEPLRSEPLRSEPHWLRQPRRGDLFAGEAKPWPESISDAPISVTLAAAMGGTRATLRAPVQRRIADAVRGEVWMPVEVAPRLSITMPDTASFLPASRQVERLIRTTVRSIAAESMTVRVQLSAPAGLRVDSAFRSVVLPPRGSADVEFRVRGSVPEGMHALTASVRDETGTADSGWRLVSYEHIRPRRIYRPATLRLRAVDVRVPPRVSVAYIRGVGDNVAESLRQLGVAVTLLEPRFLATTDLSRFTTIVIGPRAFEAHEELAAQNTRILAFARNGGTVVAQYGQYEMTRPGILPYAISIARPADRVTIEDAPVRMLVPSSAVLNTPHRIDARDFAGWVQERSIYMPRTFAPEWTPLLAMSDPGEPENRGALLVAPVGRGVYVYTSLSLFRQLPATVPGAARLMLNLLSAFQRGPY